MDDLKRNELSEDADAQDDNAVDKVRDHSTENENVEGENAKDEIVKEAEENVKVDIENDNKNRDSRKDDNEDVVEKDTTVAKKCTAEIEPEKGISTPYGQSCRPKVSKNTLCNINQPMVEIISSGQPGIPQSTDSLKESTSHQEDADRQRVENVIYEMPGAKFLVKKFNESFKKSLVNKFPLSQQQTTSKFETLNTPTHKSQTKGPNFFKPKSRKGRGDTSSARSSNISSQKEEESKEKHLISEDNKNIAADASLEEGNNSRKINKKKSKKKRKSQSSNVPKKSEESNPKPLEEIDQLQMCETEMKRSESDIIADQQKIVESSLLLPIFHSIFLTNYNLSSIAQNESKSTQPKILIPDSCKLKYQDVFPKTEEYIEEDHGNWSLRPVASNYTTRISGKETDDSKENNSAKIECDKGEVISPAEIDKSCAITLDKSAIMQVECYNESKCDVLAREQDILDKKQEFIESMNDAQRSEKDLYCSKQIALDKKQVAPVFEEGALSMERNASNSELDVSYNKLSGSDSERSASKSDLEASNGDLEALGRESSSSDSEPGPLDSKPIASDSDGNRNSGEGSSNSEKDPFVAEKEQLFIIQERNAAVQMILAKTQERLASAQEKIAVSQENFVAEHRKFAAEKEEFIEKKENFAEEKRAFAEEKRAFAEEKRAFAEEKRDFAKEKRALVEDNERKN